MELESNNIIYEPNMSQEIIDALARIEQRVCSMEHRLDQINHIQSEAKLALSAVTNTFDQAIVSDDQVRWKTAEASHQIQQTFQNMNSVETVQSIGKILSMLPQIETSLSHAKNLDQILATLTNSLDEKLAQINQQGFDIIQFQNNLAELSKKLAKMVEDGSMGQLIDSGVIDKSSIDVIGQVGKSLAESHSKAHNKAPSIRSIFASFKDMNIRYALNFFVEFCKSFGKHLQKSEA